MTENTPLPRTFRKLNISERKQLLSEHLNISEDDIRIISGNVDLSDLADVLVESSIGTFPVPMGVATGFLIDGKEYVIPMVIEEPSVIAAASHGARIVKAGGGFKTWVSDPIMTAQVYLKNCSENAKQQVLQAEERIRTTVNSLAPKMLKRGGGYHSLEVEETRSNETLCVSIHLDVRDAMGANIANTVSEGLKELFKDLTNGSVLMAILTNASENRRARAEFTVPDKYFRKDSISGEEVCKRIVEATELANTYPKRAVTHNKGVMNGITALTLATGNDTRAIEAAAHFHAQKEGTYRSLTTYTYENGLLKGSLELPLPLGTVGGSVSIWPASQLSLKLLGNPSAQELSRIAAVLGLAQNLAAINALVSDGIQRGHMKLHAARIAYSVGARGNQIRSLASKLWDQKTLDPVVAKKLLEEIKAK